MAHPIPAPHASLNPWSAACGHLVRALIRTAWAHGYIAVPRDGGDRPTVLLTPRDGIRSDRRGRLHLAPAGRDAELCWHWSDTGHPLAAGPHDERALVAEIDAVLIGAGPSNRAFPYPHRRRP